MVKDWHCILLEDKIYERNKDRLGIRMRQKVVTDINGQSMW